MVADVEKLLAEMERRNQELTKGPFFEYLKAWRGFTAVAHKEGALSRKEKELIAVSISLSKRCERCIAYHVKSALFFGASSEEILEAAFVTVIMDGGPALAYIGVIQEAIETFSKGKQPNKGGK
jgi:AhpD family alkylhydroperoxidase